MFESLCKWLTFLRCVERVTSFDQIGLNTATTEEKIEDSNFSLQKVEISR